MNFINTNFINSFGFFGFINIFGNWTGNIGGASQFAALNAQNNNQENPTSNISTDSSSNSDTTQEQGGQLSIENANNVGLYVLPGDTVTFFLKVRNTGTGKVYGTTLNLALMHNGQSLGTASFDLGDISGGKGVKVSTGIVLPKGALPGAYTAVATVTGNVGSDNNSISSSANSYFTILGNTLVAGVSTNIGNNPKTDVLGSSNKNHVSLKNASETAFYFSLILLLLIAYFTIRIIRGRKYVLEVISSNTFKEKLHSMKMLLL